jgi:hypothetical protein
MLWIMAHKLHKASKWTLEMCVEKINKKKKIQNYVNCWKGLDAGAFNQKFLEHKFGSLCGYLLNKNIFVM